VQPVLDYSNDLKRKPWIYRAVPYMALPAFWIGLVLGPLSLLWAGAAIAMVAVLIWRKRFLIAALSLLLSPMGYSAARGVHEYATGSAVIMSLGLMHSRTNIDPVTRCPIGSGGCLVFGNEWMTYGTYNLAVWTLAKCFGPMPGSYDGPYPNQSTASSAMAGASTFDLRQLPSDRFVVDSRTISLPTGTGTAILGCFREGPATDVTDPALIARYGEARVTLYGGQCVILAIPGRDPAAVPGDNRVLLLIDAKTGKAFAHYFDGYPMAFWRRVGW